MIESIRVKNYRSIKDSTKVRLDRDICTLVGGNEAGKSNFLKSITLLGDSNEIPREDLCDYNSEELKSKTLDEIQILGVDLPIQVFSTESGIPLGERRLVRTEDGDVLHVVPNSSEEDNKVTVKRYADGAHRVDFDDENIEREYIVSLIYSRLADLSVRVSVDSISSELEMRSQKLQRYGRQEDVSGEFHNYLDDIHSFIRENDDLLTEQFEAENANRDAEVLITEITKIIDSFREERGTLIFDSDLNQLPELHYFADLTEIEDEVNLSDLSEDPEVSPAYSSILEFANLQPNELDNLSSGEIRDRRQAASAKFTDLFNRYWDQSNIDIEIEISGGRVSLQFYDESEKRKAPSDRSKGLRRFVAFLAQVVTKSEHELENSIILLDNPGVHLHPEGHRNLRDSLNELAEDNQLVFATHAPYMIDSNHLDRVKIVRRSPGGIGTSIDSLGEVDTVADDSLAPVRASLGATFSDSLFSSRKTLLVEGYEDRKYLNSFSLFFREYDVGSHFPTDVQIIDCGGASKTSYMSRLISAENYDYAILLDNDDAGKDARDQLIENSIPFGSIVFTSNILGSDKDSTIEDLFSRDFFCKVVSDVHDIPLDELQKEVPNTGNLVVEDLNGAIKKIQESEESGLILKKEKIAEEICSNLLDGVYSPEDLDEKTITNFSELIDGLKDSL